MGEMMYCTPCCTPYYAVIRDYFVLRSLLSIFNDSPIAWDAGDALVSAAGGDGALR